MRTGAIVISAGVNLLMWESSVAEGLRHDCSG
jgi:hypothetical protein